MLARIEGSEFQANYLPVDADVKDASQFQTFRVRFALYNAGTDPITATPRLEFRTEGAAGYVVVPDKPKVGIPLHVAREWVPSLGFGGGTMQGPLGEDIAVADLRIGEGGGLALTGHRSMGANPDQPITLPSGSYTEEEFTVTLSLDAEYLASYELRITNAGTALTGTDVATIRLGAPPAVLLSPGQRQGVAVVDPKPLSTSVGAAYPLLSVQSMVANTTSVSAAPADFRPSTVTYPLTANTLATAVGAPDNIHGPYSMTTDKCAACHRAHTAKAPNLLVKSNSESTLCFECHGSGSQGANTGVQSQYTDSSLPQNIASAREYYSHDAVGTTTPITAHTRSELDEFGGLSNRHSECADCHNSHKAGITNSTQTATGWDVPQASDTAASGRLTGVSGVSVVNGAAGVAPTYTFLDGIAKPVTREYQLCFKCHSGFTTLTDNTGLALSKYALDKGVEFNPKNPSFHPVEAPGKNGTAAMTASLTGDSPNKLWNFNVGSTIRCLNCHATNSTPDVTQPPTDALAAGGVLPPHTSSNRGILLRNYRDRVLKPGADVMVGVKVVDPAAYSAGDFALCYVCHAEAPFVLNGSSSVATNFSLHSVHLNEYAGKGNGTTDIDTAGAGQGNAICAECHFRIHSTTNKVGVVGGSRLVNFAPNVVEYVPDPDSGPAVAEPITWTPGATSGGSCTLTCHLHKHKDAPY